MKKYYRKDWILFYEVANEGGRIPEALIDVKINTGSPDENKHVPFIEEVANGYIVKTGKNGFHATTKDHHTIFIELFVDDKYHYRQYIEFNSEPQATFNIPKGKKVVATAFCNLHGLWKSEYKK